VSDWTTTTTTTTTTDTSHADVSKFLYIKGLSHEICLFIRTKKFYIIRCGGKLSKFYACVHVLQYILWFFLDNYRNAFYILLCHTGVRPAGSTMTKGGAWSQGDCPARFTHFRVLNRIYPTWI
jgi:hypothetical protein